MEKVTLKKYTNKWLQKNQEEMSNGWFCPFWGLDTFIILNQEYNTEHLLHNIYKSILLLDD